MRLLELAWVAACVRVRVCVCISLSVWVCGRVQMLCVCVSVNESDKHLSNGTMINFHYFLTGAIKGTNSKWSGSSSVAKGGVYVFVCVGVRA